MTRSLLFAVVLAGCSSTPEAVLPVDQAAPSTLDLTITPAQAAPGDMLNIEVTGAPPNRSVYLGYSTRGEVPDALCPPILQGECIDLRNPVNLIFVVRADASGVVSQNLRLPPTVPDGTYTLQAAAPLGVGNPGAISDVETLEVSQCTAVDWYPDIDLDGYGSAAGAVSSCTPVPGYILTGGDCDDANPAISPDAVETCNGIDDNCDATIDEEGLPYYLDWDQDGYGDPAFTISACADTTIDDNGVLVNYVGNADDCNDLDDAVNPDGIEVCNLMDDNCDGAVDETGGPVPWFADVDADGFGTSGKSCADLYAGGIREDGVYTISLPSGPLDVYCNMTDDGGAWTLLLNHETEGGTVYFTDPQDAVFENEETPEAGLYSILGHLEDFRRADGALEFRINWPGSIEHPGSNVWRQTSNPTTDPVAGYQPIDITYTSQGWGGLEASNTVNALIDGTIGSTNWYYAVGSTRVWNGGIPGPNSATDAVQLWVRADPSAASVTLACEQPAGFANNIDDCDDTDPGVNPIAIETCNNIDDNCDNAIDEGAGDTWYVDDDNDGFGVDGSSDCDDLMLAGETVDGFYDITLEDGTQLSVYCDMTTDDGGWTRVFHHDSEGGTVFFANNAEALSTNAAAPDANKYSILDQLENFRNDDGTLEFRINWPSSPDYPGRNIWTQTSNPTVGPVAGYQGITIDYDTQLWGGLELSTNPRTFIDGSVNHSNWYFSIGSNVIWQGAIPGPGPIAVDDVELWVRNTGEVNSGSVQACAQPAGFAAADTDCDDTNAGVNPDAPEFCNDIDDNCNGEIDETGAVPQPAHCADHQASGATVDGLYTIDPFGDGNTLQVMCNFSADGGGWTRIFHHDSTVGYFLNDNDALLRDEADPESGIYSILGHIESFRETDGAFEMRINWPSSVDQPGRNVWTQTSNPTTEPVAGYQAVAVDYVEQFWGGLEVSDRNETFLDGSIGSTNWFYAIGSVGPWVGGIPGAFAVVPDVELWVRKDSVGGNGVCP